MGILITVYVVLIGMNIYSLETRKNQLEHVVSRAVEHGLKEGFRTEDEGEVLRKIEQEIIESLDEDSEIQIDVKAMNMQKGLLSIVVTEKFSYITGEEKMISKEKTGIMDQIEIKEEFVSVQFLVDGELYKEYRLVPGETCELPKPPEGLFSGWIRYGTENSETVEEIGPVWENQVYLAVSG